MSEASVLSEDKILLSSWTLESFAMFASSHLLLFPSLDISL